MPRRSRTSLLRARTNAHAIDALLLFVNDGRSTYEPFTFDDSNETHAQLRAETERIFETLRTAGVTGQIPTVDWRASLARASMSEQPPIPSTIAKAMDGLVDSEVVSRIRTGADDWERTSNVMLVLGERDEAQRRWEEERRRLKLERDKAQQRYEEERRRLNFVALHALISASIEFYLLHPRIEGYKILERCACCRRWWLQTDLRGTFCSSRCRRQSDNERRRSPRK